MPETHPDEAILEAAESLLENAARWRRFVKEVHGNVGDGSDVAVKQLTLGLEFVGPLLETAQQVRVQLQTEGLSALVEDRLIRIDATARHLYGQYLFELSQQNIERADILLEKWRMLEKLNEGAVKLTHELQDVERDVLDYEDLIGNGQNSD